VANPCIVDFESMAMASIPKRTPRKAGNRRQRPDRYSFRINAAAALSDFAWRQKVPGHDRPRRRQREERWTLALALEAAGRLNLPFRVAHALGNHAPDFLFTQIISRPKELRSRTQRQRSTKRNCDLWNVPKRVGWRAAFISTTQKAGQDISVKHTGAARC
jgi:hypothetical protein